MRILTSIFWFCAIVLGVTLVISYLSVYVHPGRFWIPAFFGLYFVPLVVVNALFLLGALVKRSSIAWAPFLALLPTLLFVELFVRWGARNEAGSGLSIKIATYNVCNFQGYGKKPREEAMKEIDRLLRQEDVEIVCMQEFYCIDTGKIAQFFPSYPYRYFSSKKGQKSYRGNLIFSRYPIERSGALTFEGSHRNCIYADFTVQGRAFRVYTTHLESNNISLNAIADRMRRYQEVPDEFLQVHRRIREAFRIRAQQVESISEHLKTVAQPFILCGDFNDTPVSYTYNRLQEGLTDSFRHVGNGFGATFRYLWPSLRIDYVLYNQHFTAITHTTVPAPYSDHYPVITELIIL